MKKAWCSLLPTWKMRKLFKLTFYFLIAAAIVFLYWFLPKYSFIAKNPGYCVNLTNNIYYCGSQAGLDKLFGK